MENPIKMDDLGGKPTIFGNTQLEVLGIIDKTLRFSDWVAFQEDILTCVSTLLQQYAESRHRGENVDCETKVNTVIYQPLFDLL